jgi:hypothetical protein
MNALARRSVRFGAGAILALVALAALAVAMFVGRQHADRPAPAGTISPAAESSLALAARSGDVLVGLTARPGGPAELRVFGGSGLPLNRTVSARGGASPWRVLSPVCGPGCFRLRSPAVLDGVRTPIAVRVARPGRRTREVELRLPARLPAASGGLLARAKRTMRSLHSVRVEESLSSGVASLRSSWTLVAPDRLRVVSSEGDELVVAGKRRWDRSHDGRWRESSTLPTPMPDYPWLQAAGPRILGHDRVAGTPVRLVAAAAPAKSWWFVLAVARDGRVLEMRMLAPAHFMVDRYRAFDAPASVEPPT